MPFLRNIRIGGRGEGEEIDSGNHSFRRGLPDSASSDSSACYLHYIIVDKPGAAY
jgi:hypothetical protein